MSQSPPDSGSLADDIAVSSETWVEDITPPPPHLAFLADRYVSSPRGRKLRYQAARSPVPSDPSSQDFVASAPVSGANKEHSGAINELGRKGEIAYTDTDPLLLARAVAKHLPFLEIGNRMASSSWEKVSASMLKEGQQISINCNCEAEAVVGYSMARSCHEPAITPLLKQIEVEWDAGVYHRAHKVVSLTNLETRLTLQKVSVQAGSSRASASLKRKATDKAQADDFDHLTRRARSENQSHDIKNLLADITEDTKKLFTVVENDIQVRKDRDVAFDNRLLEFVEYRRRREERLMTFLDATSTASGARIPG
ncbi:LOW QUALITY PROTEIN: hypothetical protein CVT26_015133 [Gymnopilus dilepis]|uniref:Uncharacterized protein n=1 Tax=Gymnopilus dilepis TaxID=231916 RepID=A0A409WQX1_9AGAR|nr:LOW QUALITY PROTEIN: hypothetical protein CVT26_015133 [Gymnopilus dilepis]